MNVYEELKEIAELNAKRKELTEKVSEKIDPEGLNFADATIVTGCVEKNGHLFDTEGRQLDNQGLVDNDYYCNQHYGYCEDDFYGSLYFATSEPGVFVRIAFSCY